MRVLVYSKCPTKAACCVVITEIDASKRPKIKIENCLFEWNRWHNILPTFIPPSDLSDQGFDIGLYLLNSYCLVQLVY